MSYVCVRNQFSLRTLICWIEIKYMIRRKSENQKKYKYFKEHAIVKYNANTLYKNILIVSYYVTLRYEINTHLFF